MIKSFLVSSAALLLPVVAFAEETTGGGIVMNDAFSSMDMSGIISSLATTLFTGVSAAIGLAAGVWGMCLLWRKIRGAAK